MEKLSSVKQNTTQGSRLSVIDLSSHVVHVITTRTLFTLEQLHSGTTFHQKLLHLNYFAMFIWAISV